MESQESTLALTAKALAQMERHRIGLADINFVLGRCTEGRLGYTGGCYTVSGSTVDDERIEVVIALRFEELKIKVVNVWRM